MTALRHLVLDRPLIPPYPPGQRVFHLGMGGFWGAEPMHQQDLARHPDGYGGLRGTGIVFPEG